MMKRAAINIFLQIASISFPVVFLVYIPTRGIMGSKAGNTYMTFVPRGQTVLQKDCTNLQFPVFLFLFCSLLLYSSKGCFKSSGPAWGIQLPSPSRGG